ncbi:MAG TPA: hypothetical protein VGD76_09880 [Ramlibacter sp.]
MQALLLLDQGINAIALGLGAVLMAIVTGEAQATAWGDETLSAHAWRAERARKPWARLLRPLIDVLFFWQAPLPEVNAAAGRVVRGHCERAFMKKRLRLGLPQEYRDHPNPTP